MHIDGSIEHSEHTCGRPWIGIASRLENGNQQSDDNGFQSDRAQFRVDVAPHSSLALATPKRSGRSLMEAKLSRQLSQPLRSFALVARENPTSQGVRWQAREKSCEDLTEVAIEFALVVVLELSGTVWTGRSVKVVHKSHRGLLS
jgi:hypothetical protein